MTAYYNEWDKNAAAWLRELIKQGLIADGIVDERSITEIQANELAGFTQCHFFAGKSFKLSARAFKEQLDFAINLDNLESEFQIELDKAIKDSAFRAVDWNL